MPWRASVQLVFRRQKGLFLIEFADKDSYMKAEVVTLQIPWMNDSTVNGIWNSNVIVFSLNHQIGISSLFL